LLLASPALAVEDGSGRIALEDEVAAWAETSYAPRGDALPVHALFFKEDPDRFALTAGVWWVRLKGPVRLGDSENFDVSGTLGLRAVKSVPFVRAATRIGRLQISLAGFWYDNRGKQTVEEEFEIDGVVFEVGDVIDSFIKIHAYTLDFAINLIRRDWLNLDLSLGATAIYTEGRITAVNADKEARWDQWLPLPLIGARASGYLWRYPWFYEATVGWVGFSRKALGAAAVDARFAVGYEINDWVNVRVGYRFLGIRADVDEVGVQIDLSGFYLEVGIYF
jgi:hypothetical protein